MTFKVASKLSIIFVTTFILGIILFFHSISLGGPENESTAKLVLNYVSIGMIFISMILFVIVWLMAIYQSNLPKKFFWVGMIILIVLFPVRIEIQNIRHDSYVKRFDACVMSVNLDKDMHACDKVK